MRIRRALLTLIDEDLRIGLYPTDGLCLQPGLGERLHRRGCVYLDEKRGDVFHVKCSCIPKGASLDEVKDLALKALRRQGLRNLKVEGDTITVGATTGEASASQL